MDAILLILAWYSTCMCLCFYCYPMFYTILKKILWKKQQIAKKKKKQKLEKYDLDVFASLLTSFPMNLKLKEKSTFNAFSY
jgi:hypothetical protein